MNDPIAPLNPVVPLAAVRTPAVPAAARAPVDAVAESVAPPVIPTPAPSQVPVQSPVALSVDRDASGVFVYTLTDRGTGQVLAVIPRALTQSAPGQGGGIDIQA